MECNNTARPDWNKNLTCPECVKALDEAIHKRDPSAKCDKEARAFEKKECSKAPTDGCKNDQSEYCCPDAKHCLTPTEKTCAAAGDKCDAGEVCCPLTNVLQPGAMPGSKERKKGEMAAKQMAFQVFCQYSSG